MSGQTINEQHLTIRVSGDLATALQNEAAAAGKKIRWFVREILATDIARRLAAALKIF
jgi:hypothetical protein